MKHRSEDEIIALILETVNNRQKPTRTRIMYEAFLSFSQLKEYLSFLIEKGLLEHLPEQRIYKITEKGTHFLYLHNQMSEALGTRQIKTTIGW
jgi:predicted transcriptional regulator